MKESLNYICSLFVYSLIVFVSACGSVVTTEKPMTSSTNIQIALAESTTFTPQTKLPESTLIPYSSAPKDETLDLTCRITINFFFSFKNGFDIQAYRDLFIPSSQPAVDGITPPTESLTILALMPASEWWQENFPTTPMPGNLLPELPNEYIYYVEFSGHYETYETPFYAYPDFMTIIMVADGPYSCKIKSYGKG